MSASEILGLLGLDRHIQALTAGYDYQAGAKSPKILDPPVKGVSEILGPLGLDSHIQASDPWIWLSSGSKVT